MNDQVNEITLTRDGSGFTLKTDLGENIKFVDEHLLYALEDIVYKFRGRKPKLQVAVIDQYAKVPTPNVSPTNRSYNPQQTQGSGAKSFVPGTRQQAPAGNISHDEYVSQRYNGGLGPAMSSQQNWNGFGPVE